MRKFIVALFLLMPFAAFAVSSSIVKSDGTGFVEVQTVANAINTTAMRTNYLNNVATTPVSFALKKTETYYLNCGGETRTVQNTTVFPYSSVLIDAVPPPNSCTAGTPAGYNITRNAPLPGTNPPPAIGAACTMRDGSPATVVSVTYPDSSQVGMANGGAGTYQPTYGMFVTVFGRETRLSIVIQQPQP